MAHETDHENDQNGGGDESPPGAPRWVKLLGVIVLVLVLLFVGLHLAGRGLGPATHTPVDHGQQP
jgi:hypothetical protein